MLTYNNVTRGRPLNELQPHATIQSKVLTALSILTLKRFHRGNPPPSPPSERPWIIHEFTETARACVSVRYILQLNEGASWL